MISERVYLRGYTKMWFECTHTHLQSSPMYGGAHCAVPKPSHIPFDCPVLLIVQGDLAASCTYSSPS